MSKRICWTIFWAASPWIIGTFIASMAELRLYGPSLWPELGRALAAGMTIVGMGASWTYPGWDWDK